MNFKQNLFLLNMKKLSSGFCMCFVPVVSDNDTMVGDKISNKSSSEVEPFHSPSTVSDEKDKSGDLGSFGRKNKHGRRSLTRYFKAVFFENSLIKKLRSKKLGQKLHRIYSSHKFRLKSKSKSEMKPMKIIKSVIKRAPRDRDQTIDESTRSNDSSKFSTCLTSELSSNSSSTTTLSSSSSSSSLMMVSGRSSLSSVPLVTKSTGNNDLQGKIGKGNGRRNGHGYSIAVCLLIVSLSVLVICGKVCAIFCTSTVLLFASRWIKSIKPRPITKNIVVDHRLPEIDSELYKKKIIMDGFLERNHCRNLC